MNTSIALLVAGIFAGSAHAAPPPLAVVLVVDQMLPRYLDAGAPGGGFERLRREGAVYTARLKHVPTETAVGHAALLTGCSPAQHGIMANDWWDRKAGRQIYAVEDEQLGISPRRRLCDSLADGLKEASPRSLTVTIAGKDRSAALMGARRPDLAVWFDKGRFTSSEYYGGTPAWVAAWSEKLAIPAAEKSSMRSTPRLDALTMELARAAIERLKLGSGPQTDLLTVSLAATDYTGHQYGPDSPQMKAQIEALDKLLGEFLAYLDKTAGKGKWVLALSSDHGVLPLPESDEGRKLNARRVKQADFVGKLEADLRAKFGAPKSSAPWVAALNPPHLFLNPAPKGEPGLEALKREAEAALGRHPDVEAVFDPEDLEKSTAPYADVFRLSWRPDRGGDLMILGKSGVLLSDWAGGTSHGLPYDYDAQIPLVLAGAGIKPGRHQKEALATDLAPTFGKLLGVPHEPRAPSRVLSEALK